VKQENRPESPGRREFLGVCTAAVAGLTLVGVVAPMLSSCEPTSLPLPPPTNGDGGNNNPDGVPFDVSALDVDGKAVITTIKGPDGFPILIARISATAYNALSMRCTHERRAISGDIPVGGPITCPFHGSQFSFNGSVLRGPAPTPLQAYPTTFDATGRIVRIKING
jgi:Rieske Fe-S protein